MNVSFGQFKANSGSDKASHFHSSSLLWLQVLVDGWGRRVKRGVDVGVPIHVWVGD